MQIQNLALFLALIPLAACAGTQSKTSEKPAEVVHVGKIDVYADTAIIGLPVSDLDRSKSWYERVLGSKVVYEVPEQSWCEMTLPASGTLLGLHEQPEVKPGLVNAIGLGVTDMAAARAHLVGLGVKLEGDVVEIPGIVKLLYFSDPDGNRFWFHSAPRK